MEGSMISRLERRLVLTVLAAALLGAAGCGPGGQYVWVQNRRAEPAGAGARTLIGVGDLIEVQVLGEETTSTTARVLGDGTITVPLLGPVAVVGKRPEELAAALEEQLKRYIQVPKVTVLIRESLVQVAVIGEVRQGGVVDVVAPAAVLEALAKAGGLTEFADTSAIFVLRKRGSQTERIRFKYSALIEAEPAAASFALQTGDVVVVE
jgi:polysaccharide export outer membrane protein